MTPVPSYTPSHPKLRLYEALYLMNRGFEIAILSLRRMQSIGFFCAETVNEHRVRLENQRAEANGDFTRILSDYEEEEVTNFDEMQREYEKQREDPDDVFFAARDRKKEIREQIKELQRGLDRMKPRREKKKRAKRK